MININNYTIKKNDKIDIYHPVPSFLLFFFSISELKLVSYNSPSHAIRYLGDLWRDQYPAVQHANSTHNKF
jgi:hypothetical protein